MALVRAIRKDEEGYSEWSFGHSLADYKSGVNQIIQDIYTALYEWKYNCFFALENGIDWYTRLGFKNQKDLLDQDIIETIENRQGVLNLSNFNSSLENRHYYSSCEVYTDYSVEPVTIEFSI